MAWRHLESVLSIAEIVSRFDVVAVQEVKGNIKALRHTLKALGERWSFILTDVVKSTAGNYERLAFVFDTERIKLSGLVLRARRPIEVGARHDGESWDRRPWGVCGVGAGNGGGSGAAAVASDYL